ncbi:MAG TPA: HEAT repeat domain-containing protein [Kofleriaceae bacterium]
MTPCPACDKPVDPLRSRFVSVREGKVVAYCSAECLAGARPPVPAAPVPRPAKAAAAVAAPAPAVSPATGVPTRISTPPAGVPARAATPATAVPATAVPATAVPATGDAVGPPRPVTPAPGVPITADSGPVIEILHEPASGVVTSARDARDARTEPRARHPDEIPIAAFWSADKARSDVAEAAEAPADPTAAPADRADRDAGRAAPGDAAAIAPNSPDAGLPAAARRGRADRDAGRAARGDAAAIAPTSPDAVLPAAPRRSRLPLLLLILVLLGGGGFLLYYYLVASGLASATRLPVAPSAPVAAMVAPAPVAGIGSLPPAAVAEPLAVVAVPVVPAVIDAGDAVGSARRALAGDLAATSPRVRRLAAAALARTRDAAACALLAIQIGGGAPGDDPGTSDIARLDLAYALARSGDRRGGDLLARALGAPRTDVRDEAARLLALLGDARAVPHLIDVLAVDQRRLGAAEHLAHLAEPHGLKVLDQVRADPRASADDKARATVALGIAGRGDVAGALRDMLGDPHFNAFAAAALAELKDAAARPVLERQLASPPLRVLAARALRRLDPAIDARPLLPALLDVVRSGRDIERIPAAEAILLLAGPAAWSAYD